MKNIHKVILLLIFILALVLRVTKLTDIPPSLNWDEAAAGYNAFTIANWGQDEWGNTFPLVFTSFRDDKHPVHIYTTALFYKILGKSDFVTRLPSAIFGSFFAVSVYYLGYFMFKSKIAGLFSSLFAALSLYSIHYSRGLWEANFAISLFVSGLALFYAGLKKKNYLLPLSSVAFGLSLMSYHSAKVVVLGTLPLLYLLYSNKLLKIKKLTSIAFIILFLFIGIFAIEPRLLGLARIGQTGFSEEALAETYLYKKTGNELVGQIELALRNETDYFSSDYMFISGDTNPRGFVGRGMFYYTVITLAIIGVVALIVSKKTKVLLILLSWLFLAPLPGALTTMDANSTRGIFMLGIFELMAGVGLYSLYLKLNRKVGYLLVSLAILLFLGEAFMGVRYYFNNALDYNLHDWQYGMKEVVSFVGEHPDYHTVYMTKDRSQPYIFFAYYLDYPLSQLLETVEYDQTEAKSYNTVSSFGKYNFGNWDEIESAPIDGTLYIVTPSKFSGMRYINNFNLTKAINFPDGGEAFYLVSTHLYE